MTASYTSAPVEQSGRTPDQADAAPSRRLSMETNRHSRRQSSGCTWSLLITAYVVKATGSHADYFRADRAWFYIVLLTLGYLGSRRLAKSGSRDHYDA